MIRRYCDNFDAHYRPPKEWHDQSLEVGRKKISHRPRSDLSGVPAGSEKLSMPETELFEEARKKADLTLIEADGARHLPCKAPAEHEPALLSSSDLVIGVTGLSALGTAAWQGLLSGRTGGGTRLTVRWNTKSTKKFCRLIATKRPGQCKD